MMMKMNIYIAWGGGWGGVGWGGVGLGGVGRGGSSIIIVVL